MRNCQFCLHQKEEPFKMNTLSLLSKVQIVHGSRKFLADKTEPMPCTKVFRRNQSKSRDKQLKKGENTNYVFYSSEKKLPTKNREL